MSVNTVDTIFTDLDTYNSFPFYEFNLYYFLYLMITTIIRIIVPKTTYKPKCNHNSKLHLHLTFLKVYTGKINKMYIIHTP